MVNIPTPKEYWAIQRNEALPADAFAELFPFAKKPTLTLLELATTPSLWFNWAVTWRGGGIFMVG